MLEKDKIIKVTRGGAIIERRGRSAMSGNETTIKEVIRWREFGCGVGGLGFAWYGWWGWTGDSLGEVSETH